ncbi:MAG: MFS transporter [Candidatus Heimdallarchaeota archaeon]|nr:MFS transporter [Candidatus Heimdallarchaeota archaeon]
MQVVAQSNQQTRSTMQFVPVSLAKIGIGVTIIAFSSFLNAELTFRGWTPSFISLIIGSTAIFELIRFVFARLSDQNNKTRPYYILGFILASFGITLIPLFLDPANNLLMILPMILFYIGSAIMSTLIDSHMTAIASDNERSNVATAIQVSRLTGFAVGGILGSRIFVTRGSENEFFIIEDFFTSFTIMILVLFLITGMISLLSINDDARIIDTSSEFNFEHLKEDISSNHSLLMFLFIFLYPLGLFMQDQILEPYAIIRLGFQETEIGRLVSIWASLTLIFAPIGNLVAKKRNKLSVLLLGQVTGSIGLILIAYAGYILNTSILFLGVVFFGMGSGLFAVIGVTYMLDVAALHKRNLALLISFFGVVSTFSRSLAATLAAIILELSGDSFELVFIIEAFFFLLCIIPILKLEKIMK